MSVLTRIDARSPDNNGFQLRDASGNIIATVETLSNKVKLRITTAQNVTVVKSNGAVLKRKD